MAAFAFRASCAVHAVVVAVLAGTVPDRVPLHFGADLQVDRTGSRTELLLAVGLAGLLLAAVFGGLARAMGGVRLDLVNVPHERYWKTPEHEGELRRRVRTDVLVVGAAALFLLAGESALVGVAAVSGRGLSVWSVVLLVGFLAGLAGWATWLATRRYRPPRD
ncbi:DUF1648 domain-containing protein [Modestobacter sp. VKM Ac-2986]|uniref:DUF1648 domain-containing protein n=1 Tax=Modestobacter sp. VKM Ac-2986 TaxID=3004140 RepID=UPI0022AB6376|nr:DUF1648 domain-containing protein [Modestobacter sp. VKM Ac-2986]MCZ2830152.1 DUF1648 domain-containing protein [Modestobacter sp. VKM Ac-2986]